MISTGNPAKEKKLYRGRFAPSPTGPLHFGSLIAALGSYLDARHHNGKWFIRMDDIDHLRCKPEFSIEILKALETIGFEWDGDIVYQQNNQNRYQSTLTELIEKKLTYPCTCSRKNLTHGPYPGTCRHNIEVTQQHCLRVLTTRETITLNDGLQGEYTQSWKKRSGILLCTEQIK